MDMRDVFQGRMYVKKPSQIALEVDQPEKQTVVVKGRTYTVYFPEDGNAARGEIPPELNIEHFLGFFANIGSLDKNFNLAFPSKTHDPNEGLIFLELTDLKNPQSSYAILVGIDDQSYVVRRTIIYDALGNYNRFDLKNIRFLESIPDDKFRILTDISESEILAK
jgi:outer membrane lipoprotein-sorting protein